MPECKGTPIVPVTSERPYRRARTEEEALAELERRRWHSVGPGGGQGLLKTRKTGYQAERQGQKVIRCNYISNCR